MRHFVSTAAALAAAAMIHHPLDASSQVEMGMPSVALGSGWRLTGMAQAFPVVTLGAPGEDEPLGRTSWYLTQPALMATLSGPGERLVLHTTLNFEGLTQEDGEITYGGWGEGFIDKRHPHTLLHELMLSYNVWDIGGGSLSLSAGKGFAPYGTSDPMARPGLKYPTNHHLSQVLERWTLNASFLHGGWSLEASLFGGQEPDGPYDFSNVDSFGNSWSFRLARRWGAGSDPFAEWEAATSFAHLTEYAHTEQETTYLLNGALLRDGPFGGGELYALVEGSASFLRGHRTFFSVLGETSYARGPHQPYVRAEYARRPEYQRLGPPGEEAFFRYEHHEDPVGTTRWLILTAGYGYEVTGAPWSLRPFVEVQHHRIRADQGAVTPRALYGTASAWMLTFGARVFLGGDPMRMGSYGVLDPMTVMQREMGEAPMDHTQH